MARQTRQQRRQRRAESAEQVQRAQPRAAASTPRPARAAAAAEHHEPRAVPGSGLVHFVRESIGELKKVEWPGQKQVITGTAVVLIACLIVGVYLWVNDLVWQRFVENVLLK